MTKLKNLNFYKTQKLKLSQNSKKQILTKFKNSNCDNTQKLKLWQNSITQIGTTQKVKLRQNSIYQSSLKESFSKNNLTPLQQMKFSLGSVFLRFLLCFFLYQYTAIECRVDYMQCAMRIYELHECSLHDELQCRAVRFSTVECKDEEDNAVYYCDLAVIILCGFLNFW